MICKAEISEAERAQIEDIVKRKTGIAPENIVITPLNQNEETEETSEEDQETSDTANEDTQTDAENSSEDQETSAEPEIQTEGIYD